MTDTDQHKTPVGEAEASAPAAAPSPGGARAHRKAKPVYRLITDDMVRRIFATAWAKDGKKQSGFEARVSANACAAMEQIGEKIVGRVLAQLSVIKDTHRRKTLFPVDVMKALSSVMANSNNPMRTGGTLAQDVDKETARVLGLLKISSRKQLRTAPAARSARAHAGAGAKKAAKKS